MFPPDTPSGDRYGHDERERKVLVFAAGALPRTPSPGRTFPGRDAFIELDYPVGYRN